MGGELLPTHTGKLEQTLSAIERKNWELQILENDHEAPLSSAKKGHTSPRGCSEIFFFLIYFIF